MSNNLPSGASMTEWAVKRQIGEAERGLVEIGKCDWCPWPDSNQHDLAAT